MGPLERQARRVQVRPRGRAGSRAIPAGLRLGWSAQVDGAWIAGNCGSLSEAKDAAQAAVSDRT